MNRFNIPELYAKVFGTKGIRFDSTTRVIDAKPQSNSNFEVDVIQSGSAIARSYLGTPIMEQISFSLPGKENIYTFPDWPLIDVSVSKNIVKTPIKGRNGTVKEYINTDDYHIKIRGILINNDSEEYPEELVNEIHEIFKLNREIRVTNAFLNLLGIDDIVITDFKLPEVEGFPNIQPFVIECLSDFTYEVSIRDTITQTKIPRGLN